MRDNANGSWRPENCDTDFRPPCLAGYLGCVNMCQRKQLGVRGFRHNYLAEVAGRMAGEFEIGGGRATMPGMQPRIVIVRNVMPHVSQGWSDESARPVGYASA